MQSGKATMSAGDLAAVIAATGANKPVLVGRALGGVVISNYLAAHGDSQIGGGGVCRWRDRADEPAADCPVSGGVPRPERTRPGHAPLGGLQKAQVPVLLLYGERDVLVNANAAMARARQLNFRATQLVYAESGHAPFTEEPGLRRCCRGAAGTQVRTKPGGRRPAARTGVRYRSA
jgi:non-heme chloroperoxidase